MNILSLFSSKSLISILDELKILDPRIVTQNARKGLNRINNNLMFHPDRPTYKDHFGIGFGYGKGLADFYIHLGVNETLVARSLASTS